MEADSPPGPRSTPRAWGWAGEDAARAAGEEAVLLTSAEGVIRDASAAASVLLGVPGPQLAGHTLEELVEPGHRSDFREVLASTLAGAPRREWLAWMKPPASAPVPVVVATRLEAAEVRWLLREPAGARAAVRRLQDELAEKEARLAEVVHRVKNNLQLVSSLLNLQAQAAPEAAEALQAAKSRVLAMAIVHDTLARRGAEAPLDMREYVARLAQCYDGPVHGARLRLDVGDVQVAPRQALPLALIANELVSNAVRHAFPAPAAGEVVIGLRATPGGLEMTVKDDGIGRGDAGRGLGLQLVELWVEELGARLDWDAGPGTTARVTLPAGKAGE